jgi:hypothetical protein
MDYRALCPRRYHCELFVLWSTPFKILLWLLTVQVSTYQMQFKVNLCMAVLRAETEEYKKYETALMSQILCLYCFVILNAKLKRKMGNKQNCLLCPFQNFYRIWHTMLNNIVTCRPISRQHPKYTHATIEKILQELFFMWSAPCPSLGNGSLNTFPQKQSAEQQEIYC